VPGYRNSGDLMDFAELLSDSWAYTRDDILKNTTRWLQLILAVLCLGLPFNGYILAGLPRNYTGARSG
jgi:hypothetical protein